MDKIRFLIGFAILALLISCVKDQLIEETFSINGPNTMAIDSSLGFRVGVHYNTLCFPTADDALIAMRTLSNMSQDERRNWEKSIGFTSSQSLVEDIRSEIEKVKSSEELASLIEKNKNYIIVNSTDSLLITSRVYGNYSLITNDLGYFANDLYINKVMDGNLYSAFFRYLPAVEAKYQETIQNTKIEGLDKFDVQVLNLQENNEEELKSAVLISPSPTNTFISVHLGNHDDATPWTRRAIFTIQLMNSYVRGSIPSYIKTYSYYYFVVYYNNGLNPYDYGYYGQNFGGTLGWQDFIHYYGGINGDDYWKIQVPSDAYFDNYPSPRPPIGDIEMYISEVFQKNYYNWTGDIYYKMQYNIEGRRNTLFPWEAQSDEYAYFYNIDVDADISFDNPWGRVAFLDTDNMGHCNISHETRASNDSEAYIYSVMFPNAELKPVARFKNVHGVLGYQRYVGSNGEYYLNFSF
ncbi:MAG: hypothetical protein JXR22_08185 [Prolixibacteraceae bacterium]|nr:hypothetical protein [Prolixibacteraceae bacterium]